ncbi:hypothetical protein AC578_4288 [Lecanosticta acicola]|uniref:Rhodopsin domain-containing protein n=1 Tax=Lecanosticta acicola TaxID=111012 RepID=A0AAI9EC86_9PEZI|nr:hypothetical protein AC578_4288 [Lecanosticta acicola]
MSNGPYPLPDLHSGTRSFITTDQDHGGIALVICTLMATWVVLCFFVRVYMRATVSGPFGADDILCSVSTVFGVVQAIVSAAAVSFGFGKYLELLTPSQIDRASKAIYVTQLLYIVTVALSKCTVALLLARLVFIKSRVHACYGILAASVLWGVSAFLAEAIRCTETAPWRLAGSQCTNQTMDLLTSCKLTAWRAITAFNVLIEVALLAIPIWLVWPLQTTFMRKFTVVAVFWLRSPVIACALLRIHFLADTIDSPQPLYRGVVPFILLNLEMHYGLMASTWPTLKPFVSAFNTGFGTYDTQGISGYGGSSGSYAMASLERKSNRKSSAPNIMSPRSDGEAEHGGIRSYGKNVTQVQSASGAGGPTGRHSAASDNSTRGIIQTLTCEVHYEDEEARRKDPASRGENSIDRYPPSVHTKVQ